MQHKPEPWLERSLLFSWLIHAVAMIAMATLLVPGLPGGGNGPDQRLAYVAAHPWLWRLGWIPWQLTALSDLLISIALVRTRWVPRAAAWLGLLFTIAAILPEQTGEFRFILHAPAIAQAGNLAAYGALETRLYLLTSAWGACLYAVAALCWSWCFAAAGTWRRWMTPFAITLWLFFAYISGGLLLPPPLHPSAAFVAAGNAVGFMLLMVWFTVVTELVLRRSRPDGAHGRERPWRHPKRGLPGRLADLLANSRLVRAWCELLPVIPMLSDIRDVIYINYVIPAERLAALVPDGLELQRIGPHGHHALFTFLTFRHGHFGPRFLGPLRRLLPSPVQTNWRIYVRDPVTGHDGVYFVTNAIDSTVHALGDQHPTNGPWREAFNTYTEMLTHCVPQDRALSCQPWRNRVSRQEIILEIPLAACEPLVGTVHSPAAKAIVGDAQSFCFRVARVYFRFEREEHDLRQQSSTATPAARSRSAS